ncbi:MAG: DUF2332 domain-containing protein [Deltaproteobacteria bacterium]|nr:DUF2332 domain-containing protein [Deltaproteobacteria bacterium]
MSREAPSRGMLAEAFRSQALGCASTGSPIYAELLARAGGDLAAGGVFAEIVADYRGHPLLDALALRIFAAVHALVLAGDAPALAAHYPSAGGRYEAEGAWRALHALARERRDDLRVAAVARPVQTNEVRRCAVLLGGFLRVAHETGLPLRLREVGASAGLNLGWDRYRYALGPQGWGEPRARVVLGSDWSGALPPLAAPVRVASRAGCDVAPIDLRDGEQCRKLESFVWPEQLERLATLRAAIAALRPEPPPVEAAHAGDWVARELAAPAPGEATVLFHSVVWWYLSGAERQRIDTDVRAAGARATPGAPLAWLRMEGARLDEAELRLLLWPGGEDRLLARTHWHGAWVHWL